MTTPKKRFQLEIGNNWWSRLLILLYVVLGLAPLIKSNWIGSLAFLAGGFILWKIACWIVNGSGLTSKRQGEIQHNIFSFLIGFLKVCTLLAIILAVIILIGIVRQEFTF